MPLITSMNWDGSFNKAFNKGPNTLDPNFTFPDEALQYGRVEIALSEGPIGGLVDGLKSVFMDGTAIIDSSDNFMFSGVSIAHTLGTNTQGVIPGFESSESETSVGVEVVAATPVIRTISTSGLSALRIQIGIPLLKSIDTKTGVEYASSVTVKIERKLSEDESWTELDIDKDGIITGYFSSRIVLGYRIELPTAGPWDIRVTRVTADYVPGASLVVYNKTYWDGYTEIIDARLRYPNTALLAALVNAKQFPNLPAIHSECYGVLVSVPTNYTPASQDLTTKVWTPAVYATTGPGTTGGLWDGTFKTAWTSNPAWLFYNLATNSRYGAGLSSDQIDKWALYEISQVCDEMVDSGKAAPADTEPRFVCSLHIQGQNEAIKVLSHLASAFRGMLYYSGGVVVPVQDVEQDPSALFTNANVIDGKFVYQGTAKSARHTAAMVSWLDPAAGYTRTIEYVEDQEAILRYGLQTLELEAIGCTSQAQAHRFGRWALLTEQLETEVVTFKAGLDSSTVRPGDVIQVEDHLRQLTSREGGRVRTSTTSAVTLDSSVTLTNGVTYYLACRLSDGTVEKKTVAKLVEGASAIGTLESTHAGVGASAIKVGSTIWLSSGDSIYKIVPGATPVRYADPQSYDNNYETSDGQRTLAVSADGLKIFNFTSGSPSNSRTKTTIVTIATGAVTQSATWSEACTVATSHHIAVMADNMRLVSVGTSGSVYDETTFNKTTGEEITYFNTSDEFGKNALFVDSTGGTLLSWGAGYCYTSTAVGVWTKSTANVSWSGRGKACWLTAAQTVAAGRIIVLGPDTASTAAYSVGFDRTITTLATMNTARALPGICRATDGKIYVFGGYGSGGTGDRLDSIEVYDPDTDAWTELAAVMPYAAYNCAAIACDSGRILLVGGNAATDKTLQLNYYDPILGTWHDRDLVEISTPTSFSTLRVTEAFSSAPPSEGVWILQEGSAAALYRVVSIKEVDALNYEVTALKNDPDKYDDTIDITPPDDLDPSDLAAPVVTLAFTVRSYQNKRVYALDATWPEIEGAIAYNAAYSVEYGPWVVVPTIGSTAHWNDVPAGDYRVRVQAGYTNGWSVATEEEITVEDITADGYLSIQEKPGVVSRFTTAQADKDTLIGKAAAAGVSYEVFLTAFNTLEAFLESLTPAYDDLTSDTPLSPLYDPDDPLAVTGTQQYWNGWEFYETAKTELATSIAGITRSVSAIGLANLALPVPATGTFDGHEATTGSKIMLAAQTTPAENGIYLFTIVPGGGGGNTYPSVCEKTSTSGTLTNPSNAIDNDADYATADAGIYTMQAQIRGWVGTETAGDLKFIITPFCELGAAGYASSTITVSTSTDGGLNWTSQGSYDSTDNGVLQTITVALTDISQPNLRIKIDLNGQKITYYDEGTKLFDLAQASAYLHQAYFDADGGGAAGYLLEKTGEVKDGESWNVAYGDTYGGKIVSVGVASDNAYTLTISGVLGQPVNPNLTAISALATNGLYNRTGDGTAEIVTITAAGKAIIDDATAADQRNTLGLGTAATKDAGTTAGTLAYADQTMYLGTTQVAINRASAALNLNIGGTFDATAGTFSGILKTTDATDSTSISSSASGVFGGGLSVFKSTYTDKLFAVSNIAIGIANPTAKLEIYGGTARFWHGGSSEYTEFRGTNELNHYTAAGGAATLYLQYPVGSFDTNIGRNALTVKGNGGNVGVGTSSPNQKLVVSRVLTNAHWDALAIANSGSWSGATGKHANIIFTDSTSLSHTLGAIGLTYENSVGRIDIHSLYSGGYKTDSDITASLSPAGLGLGVTNPTALLHLKAGTATAGTAPILMTSGALLTAPVAGTLEFLTDKYYATITTGSTRKEIALCDSYFGGVYAYDKAIAFNITVADTYHAFAEKTAGDITPGLLSGFTTVDGRVVDANITSEASGTGGKLRIVCSAAHGLTTGNLVVIGNANNAGHNKPTRITTDGTNPTTEFLCDDIAYVAGAGASAATVTEPTQIIASTGSDGYYYLGFTIDGTAAAANKTWKWEMNINVTPCDNIVSKRTSTNTMASQSAFDNVQIAAGDRIWLSGKNATDTSDYTVENMNFNLHRL